MFLKSSLFVSLLISHLKNTEIFLLPKSVLIFLDQSDYHNWHFLISPNTKILLFDLLPACNLRNAECSLVQKYEKNSCHKIFHTETNILSLMFMMFYILTHL
ncbi:hypothetical protein EDEG_00615 [Edhazardia aedis USNM 41457]|uniref:Uncharacterized protein n=1 Tax=Edhazardia aedis (strain USNM 41457) TaxID=1003232 RepID=J9DVJ5_EDHAE|nr:hypothetical protein EDEG_00615 [Edhazardia aedis USNM 41457]|eukprot:EJW05312.1 hypothetical protein EDEG_00615 [Edhazardia aedis USNM 41457]